MNNMPTSLMELFDLIGHTGCRAKEYELEPEVAKWLHIAMQDINQQAFARALEIVIAIEEGDSEEELVEIMEEYKGWLEDTIHNIISQVEQQSPKWQQQVARERPSLSEDPEGFH